MYRTNRRSLFAATIRAAKGPARRDAPADDPSAGSDLGGGAPANQEPDDSASTDADASKADDGKQPKIKGDYDPDRAAKALAASRAAETKAKDRARAAEQRIAEVQAEQAKAIEDLKTKLAVALGLQPDKEADPAELAKAAAEAKQAAEKERDDAVARVTQMQVETAIVRLGAKAGADVDELLDSTAFRKQINDLDPSADSFEAELTERIKAAVKANPKRYAAASAVKTPARQGADITPSGGGAKTRPTSLGEAIAKKYAG